MDIFPYQEPRPFQREIYLTVYEALRRGRPALINAPTGLGKTAAVLSAAVKYALETGVKIHYAVRTRNELAAPLRELARLRERGVEVDYVVIKSRQDMCCYAQMKKMEYLAFLAECNLLKAMGKCEYYPPKEADVPLRDVNTYVKYLCALRTCPYEYAKERLDKATVAVSTYYYVFGWERNLKGKVVIVDEAHALFDSVTSIYTLTATEQDLRAAYRECRKYGLVEEAGAIYRLLTLVRKTSGEVPDLLGELEAVNLDAAVREIVKRKAEEGKSPYTPLLLVRELRNALKSRLGYIAEVRTVDSSKALVLTPIDPVSIVKKAVEEAVNTIYISGTLPIKLFSEMLGLRDYYSLDISFRQYIPRENYISVIDIGVTTRYQERGEEMYLKLAERIAAVVNLSPGGVLAVFPSYEVMKAVRKYLRFSIPHWYEGSDGVNWGSLPEKFFIGAVARGRYTEGVEYTAGGKNYLTTVVVVGVPYPEPSPYLDRRVEALRPRMGELAWSAVYLYQALVSVRQAVGRLFRGPNDRGALIFLDRRYAEPEVWNNLRDILEGSLIVNNVEEAADALEAFFTSSREAARGQWRL